MLQDRQSSGSTFCGKYILLRAVNSLRDYANKVNKTALRLLATALVAVLPLNFAMAGAIPNNVFGSSAIPNCLNESAASRVTGDCPIYGASTGYGTMPNWDTSLVTDMNSAFIFETAFNGDISGWDTSSVNSMQGMFNGASTFDQNIRT